MSDSDVTLTKSSDGLISIIKLNQPESLNSLDEAQYFKLAQFLQDADKDPVAKVTLLLSSGKFFSAGANIKFVSQLTDVNDESIENKKKFMNLVSIRNIWLTYLFNNHSKVLITGLNGPVIGLSASMISLSDFIYAMNPKVYLLVPFSNLGLINEGGSSQSLIQRLGLSKASEALLMSKPIYANDLKQQGFVNEIYEFEDVEKFNDFLIKEVTFRFKNLDLVSVLENKKMIRSNFNTLVDNCNVSEALQGLNKWIQGTPQKRFKQVVMKERKHKL